LKVSKFDDGEDAVILYVAQEKSWHDFVDTRYLLAHLVENLALIPGNGLVLRQFKIIGAYGVEIEKFIIKWSDINRYTSGAIEKV